MCILNPGILYTLSTLNDECIVYKINSAIVEVKFLTLRKQSISLFGHLGIFKNNIFLIHIIHYISKWHIKFR